MIKILFSPSEGKQSGGIKTQQRLFGAQSARDKILQEYNAVVQSGDEEQIKELFGIKKFSECTPYINNIFDTELMAAIERYQGVAYDYLEYHSLTHKEQEYLKQNTLIFSNLYGPLLAGDMIANYKVKQGNSIGNIAPDKFYKERFSYQLDLYLGNTEILDLRAGYYDKFYRVTQPYTTLKFLKNGKSVSHWAKAYRGILLRELAKAEVTSLQELQALEIENLAIKEIKIIKNRTEIVFDIMN